MIEKHPLNDHNFGELVSHRVTESGRSPHREYGITYEYKRGIVEARIGKNGFYMYESIGHDTLPLAGNYVEQTRPVFGDCPF